MVIVNIKADNKCNPELDLPLDQSWSPIHACCLGIDDQMPKSLSSSDSNSKDDMPLCVNAVS